MAGATSFRRTRTSRPELMGVRGKLLAALLFQQSDVVEDAPFDESRDSKPRSVKYRASQSLQHGDRQLHGDSFPLLARLRPAIESGPGRPKACDGSQRMSPFFVPRTGGAPALSHRAHLMPFARHECPTIVLLPPI